MTSRNTLCEMIIRQYAQKFLGMKEPFELSDIKEFPDTEEKMFRFNRMGFNFTADDLAEAMIFAGMKNEWSKSISDRIIRNGEMDSMEIVSVGYSINDSVSIYLYDILTSLPASDKYFRKCKKCGRYFITENKNSEYCEREYLHN